jgi:oligogalacturonide lyase
METGGQKMPDEWIDQSTGHKIIRLTRMQGSSVSFYFHNNPFIGNKMVFYNSSLEQPGAVTDMRIQDRTNRNVKNKQLYLLDLKTLSVEQLTNQSAPMSGEIVSAKTKQIFFQVADSVFSVDVETKKQRLVFVFPADFKGGITTVNADGSLLAVQKHQRRKKRSQRSIPPKAIIFNRIFEARLPRTLFYDQCWHRQAG